MTTFLAVSVRVGLQNPIVFWEQVVSVEGLINSSYRLGETALGLRRRLGCSSSADEQGGADDVGICSRVSCVLE